ncbi:MAG: hypothetical protein ACRD0K_06025 [Egibacteraceae bacterium]
MPAQPNPYRVEVTPTRYTLRPPCCPRPLVLARDVTDIHLIHDVTCAACGVRWQLAFLGDHKVGLWVSWQPIKQP